MKWCKKGGTQILGYTFNQGTHKNPFGLSVGAIGAVVLGESTGLAQNLPPRSPIAGAMETRGIHKGLGQHDGMPKTAQPIRTEAPEVLRQDPGGKIWSMTPRQDEKPNVVGQKVQAFMTKLSTPAYPSISGSALQCRGCPAEQSDPLSIDRGHVMEPVANHPAGMQIMIARHKGMPSVELLHPGKAHMHIKCLLAHTHSLHGQHSNRVEEKKPALLAIRSTTEMSKTLTGPCPPACPLPPSRAAGLWGLRLPSPRDMLKSAHQKPVGCCQQTGRVSYNSSTPVGIDAGSLCCSLLGE